MHDDLKTDSDVVFEENFSAEQQRQMELRRLEKLLNCWYPIAVPQQGDVSTLEAQKHPDIDEETFDRAAKALPLVLRIMERKAELLGLHHIETESPAQTKEKSLAELAETIKAQNPYLFLPQYEQNKSQTTSDI